MTSILSHATASLADGVNDYARGYDAGKKAGATVAVGTLFRGAMGYADHYAGSTKACRETAAWQGACNGYLDGLAATKVTVDAKGIVISVEL